LYFLLESANGAQAQDRAHRIGQQKPVLIFRLVSAHTVETKIMQRATEKRKLEALIIAKGSLFPTQSIYQEY
jgi:SNF2 family DNA or RNA helicase